MQIYMSKQKRTYIVCLLLILTCVLFLPVLADSAKQAYGSFVTDRMLKDITQQTTAGDIANIVGSDYPDAWNVMLGTTAELTSVTNFLQPVANGGIYGSVIEPIAYAVLGFYFVLSLSNLVTNINGFSTELLIRPFIYYIIAGFFVNQTPRLLRTILHLGGQAIINLQSAAGQVTSNTAAFDTIKQGITGEVVASSSLWGTFLIVVRLFLPWVLSLIARALMLIMAYGIILELFVRAMLMGFSYGGVILRGIDGGFDYLKQFVACAFRGFVIVLVAMIAGWIQTSILSTSQAAGLDYAVQILNSVVIEYAAIALMRRSDQMIREALHVR